MKIFSKKKQGGQIGNKNCLGYKHTEEARENMKKAFKYNHKKWENLKLDSKHCRIRKKYGNPKFCEICKRTDKKEYHWSNKDHKYSENFEDWQRLCKGCHLKFDYEFNNRTRIKPYDKKRNRKL